MAAHGPLLPRAVDHLSAVGGGCSHWGEGKDQLLNVGEVNLEALLRCRLGSAGGDDAINCAVERPSRLVLNRGTTTEIVRLADLFLKRSVRSG